MRALFLAGVAAVGLIGTASAAPITFSYTGGFQSFTAPTTGTYAIIAFGAQGASESFGAGGLGAEIGGDFLLTQGDVLSIAVGGRGVGVVNFNGGGGGSFVVGAGSTPLVIAGGGGGTGGSVGGGAGQIGTSGGAGTGVNGGAGGTGGNGGAAGADSFFANSGGGGGGGFYSSGAGNSDVALNGGGGGQSYALGLGGGNARFGGVGGFGGGGGGGFLGGGGGGGYSGGGGGSRSAGGGGGGGGSFLAANVLTNADLIQLAGVRSGNGLVTIDLISAAPTSVPEPASLALLGIGVAGIAAVRRRRA